jgi:hypothetical protein
MLGWVIFQLATPGQFSTGGDKTVDHLRILRVFDPQRTVLVKFGHALAWGYETRAGLCMTLPR